MVKKIILIIFALALVIVLVKIRNNNQTTTPPINSSTITSITPAPHKSTGYYYPIGDYNNRLKLRRFGQYLTSADQQTVPCGAVFTGYHDGDDLEVTSQELNIDVPVYSITKGTVLSVSNVSGYGGLIVVQYNLNNQEVTANYGHIDLSSVTVNAGDLVTAGQKLANLGKSCSTQTDFERKHLHFAIHKGTTIDVAGYVQTKEELNNWLNPSEELLSLKAVNP